MKPIIQLIFWDYYYHQLKESKIQNKAKDCQNISNNYVINMIEMTNNQCNKDNNMISIIN